MARASQFPPSVDPGLPVEPLPSDGWPRRTFGELLEVVERPVRPDDDTEYQLVTAKRSRGGVVARERLKGRDVLTKTQFWIREGDFLISRRQIIHGACGVVPPDLDSAIVSNEYATLRPKEGLLLDYLKQLSHTPYFQRTCFHSSVGVDVEKMIFKLEDWLRYGLPVPPPGEQRKIVAILSSIEDTIDSTQAVIDQLQVVKKALMAELLTRGLPGRHKRFKQTEIGEVPEEWQVVPLGDLLDGIDAGWSPQCASVPPAAGQWGVLKVSAASSGTFQPQESKALPPDLKPRPELEVRPGDLIIVRANGVLNLVGRTALVGTADARLMLSDKLLRLRPNQSRSSAPYLHVCLADERVRAQMTGRVAGSEMRNISQDTLRKVLVPCPPLNEQESIGKLLAELDARITAEKAGLEATAHLRAALSTALLSGEVRVIP